MPPGAPAGKQIQLCYIQAESSSTSTGVTNIQLN